MSTNAEEYAEMYRSMHRIRAFETAAADLWTDGEIHGELHLSSGHEAVAAGIGAHLRDEDAIVGTHRAHNAAVATGVDLYPLLAEILGREAGLSRGKGGHMDLFDTDTDFGCSEIIGAGLPPSLGPGIAATFRDIDTVSVAFLGEGARESGFVPRKPQPGEPLGPSRDIPHRRRQVGSEHDERGNQGRRLEY